MRIQKKDSILGVVNGMLIDYPSPSNISYLWNYGSLAGLCLVIQLVTGIFLAMHYTPHVDYAFSSVEHIMRDVNYGWLLRYIHANGASMFLLTIYIHIFRGMYYGSYTYPRQTVWYIGVTLLLLTIITAFLGYVLPWGQMSFWGATVITNLVSAVPVVGTDIVYWLWGGFSVDNATLNRFFSLHYLLPFIIAALSALHLIILHTPKSNNPLGLVSTYDRVPFHPYYTTKDLYGLMVFFLFFGWLVFYHPNLLGHSDNYIEANPMVTPTHIVPEWYFLPFYAILRSIPSKLGGVIAMILSILVFYLLPILHTSEIRSSSFRPIYKIFFWIFLVNAYILYWIGGAPVETPYYEIGQISTFYYFFALIILKPLIGILENILFQYSIDSKK